MSNNRTASSIPTLRLATVLAACLAIRGSMVVPLPKSEHSSQGFNSVSISSVVGLLLLILDLTR